MSNVFLGRPIHWLIVAALVVLGWVAGRFRLHVTEFNPFVVLLLLIVAGALVAVIATTRPGQRVTRDPLVDE